MKIPRVASCWFPEVAEALARFKVGGTCMAKQCNHIMISIASIPLSALGLVRSLYLRCEWLFLAPVLLSDGLRTPKSELFYPHAHLLRYFLVRSLKQRDRVERERGIIV